MAGTASSLLARAGDLPRHEAERLLLAAVGVDRRWLLTDGVVDVDTADRFELMVERRRSGEPLQYIEGTVHFGPISLAVDRRALIPRPETERLWELGMEVLSDRREPVVVDLCTGSGNLALAIKHARPDARVVATDVSPDAIALARANAQRLNLDVEFGCGDLLDPVSPDLVGRVDLIVSNPPYVATEEYDDLPAEVAEYEPLMALVAGGDGLDVLRRIAGDADAWLRPGGVVACEIGETQGAACLELFAHLEPQISQDLTGRDRFVLGSAPERGDLH